MSHNSPLREEVGAQVEPSSVPPTAPARPTKTSADIPGKKYGKLARRGVAWSFVREGVTELVATPSALILARLLTPFDFGVTTSVAFFITLATRLTNVGFNLAIVRIKHLKPEHTSSVFVVVLGIGATAYAVLASSGSLMASVFRAPQLEAVMPVAALCFLITPFGSVPAALMSRDMRFRETAICDWVCGVAQASCSIALALAGYGYWSLIYGQLAGDVAGTAAKLILGRWRPSVRFSAAAMKELLSFGTGVFVKRLLDYSGANLDNLVVGRTLGLAPLGFYDKGFNAVRKAVARLNTGGPIISFRVLALLQSEPERFRDAYRRIVLATALLTYPVLLGLMAAAPDLIPVMFGARWLPAIVPFQILCVSFTFRVLNEYAGSAAQALGEIWGQVGRQIVQVTLVVVFVFVGSRWGLPGAAFGVLLANLVMYLLMEALLIRLTSITAWMILEAQLPGVLCGIAVAAAIFAAGRLTNGYAPTLHQWQRLGLELLAGVVAYSAFIKFNRFRKVRRLVRDTAADLPLGRVVRLLA